MTEINNNIKIPDVESMIEMSKNIENEEKTMSVTLNLNDLPLRIVDIPSFGWMSCNGDIKEDDSYQQHRRKSRKSFTETGEYKALYDFFIAILNEAKIRELSCDDSCETRYYTFDPYFPKSYWYNKNNLDEFSDRSIKKDIGIKTKLDKYHANLILSIYYLLYSRFELTSDETIFESSYRNAVLVRDNTFELSQFYERLLMEYHFDIDPITSLVNDCLDIFLDVDGNILFKMFGDISLQYDIWLLTFSKHVKEVIIPDYREHKFLSIDELLSNYDESWFDRSVVNPNDTEVNEMLDDILNDITSMEIGGLRQRKKRDENEDEPLLTMPSTLRRNDEGIISSIIYSIFNYMR